MADVCNFRPKVSVGCSYCIGTIAALSEAECRVGEMPWRWGRAPIDQAASLADYALGDQVLCAESVQEAVADEDAGATAVGIGSFEEFCRRQLPGAKKPTAVFQFDADGVAPREFAGRSECSSLDSGLVGGVLAALEADAGGVNTRKVAMVALYCTAFEKKGTLNAMGKIAAVVDSALFITVNATGPAVSQAPARAAAIAVECVDALSDVTGAAVYAGIEYGPCAVGNTPGCEKDSPGNVTLPQNALMLAKIAESGPCPVVAGHSAYSDLEVAFMLRSVDIVGYFPRTQVAGTVEAEFAPPVEQLPSLLEIPAPSDVHPAVSSPNAMSRTTSFGGQLFEAGTRADHRADHHSDQEDHTVDFPCTVRMAHGILETSSAGAEDDEWMYQLTDAESGNPFKISNGAMAAILKGKGPNETDTADASHVDFNAVEDGVVTALVEAIEQCSGKTFAKRLKVYAVQRTNRAFAPFPIVGLYK